MASGTKAGGFDAQFPRSGAAGGFAVDTEAAAVPAAKREEALDRLNSTLVRLERGSYLEPPAADHVSVRVAANYALMARNARDYVGGLRDRVQAARDALQAQLGSYSNLMIGNAHDYVQALHARVEAARDALRAQNGAYESADDPRTFRA